MDLNHARLPIPPYPHILPLGIFPGDFVIISHPGLFVKPFSRIFQKVFLQFSEKYVIIGAKIDLGSEISENVGLSRFCGDDPAGGGMYRRDDGSDA